jgi:hypothetical protein
MSRAVLKRLTESALLHGGPATFLRRKTRHRTLVLAYHNILPQGAAPGRDRSLHLECSAFAGQLDLLLDCCDVVPLTQLSQTQS